MCPYIGQENSGIISSGNCLCTAGTVDSYKTAYCESHDDVNETQTHLANISHPVHAALKANFISIANATYTPTPVPTAAASSVAPTSAPTNLTTSPATSAPTSATTAAATSVTTSAGPQPSLETEKIASSGDKMATVGTVVGSAVALLLLIALMAMFVFRRKERSATDLGLIVKNPGVDKPSFPDQDEEMMIPCTVAATVVQVAVDGDGDCNGENEAREERAITVGVDELTGKKIQVLGRGTATVTGVEDGVLDGQRRRHSLGTYTCIYACLL